MNDVETAQKAILTLRLATTITGGASTPKN
jgi:hypothetical protein